MTRSKLRAAVVSGTAALTLLTPALAATTATSASAGGGSASRTTCFDPASGKADARGATVNRGADHRAVTPAEQKQIEQRAKQLRQARTQAAAAGNPISSIPVYVHVMIGKNNAGNVTDSQITRQISVLNATYGGADVDGTGRNTGVAFYLAGTDRYVNAQWHLDKSSSSYRSQTRQGDKNALNIWLVDFSYLGIATFPWDYSKQPKIDGIRVNFDSLPGGSIANYNQGETATHESGHWLGLYHTFQGGCADPGDEVADTAAQASPSTGCPTGRDSCPAPGLDPIHNYMDYSYDSCYTTFSPGQDTRIHQMWAAYRA